MVFNWEIDVLGDARLPAHNIEVQKLGDHGKRWLIIDHNVLPSPLNRRQVRSRSRAIKHVERFFLVGEASVE